MSRFEIYNKIGELLNNAESNTNFEDFRKILPKRKF
jgi:hypothetical protein